VACHLLLIIEGEMGTKRSPFANYADKCLMEGISSEAASLAGHWRLSNLCWIYDNNHITIEGNTALAFSEDVATRFIAYGWNVTRVGDANDLQMLASHCQAARGWSRNSVSRRPRVFQNSAKGFWNAVGSRMSWLGRFLGWPCSNCDPVLSSKRQRPLFQSGNRYWPGREPRSRCWWATYLAERA